MSKEKRKKRRKEERILEKINWRRIKNVRKWIHGERSVDKKRRDLEAIILRSNEEKADSKEEEKMLKEKNTVKFRAR